METLVLDFHYGAHGAYVWSAWGLSLLIMLVMAVSPSLRWRAFKRRIALVRRAEAGET